MSKYWLVGLLVVLAFLLGVIKFKYRNYQWDRPVEIVKITPTQMPTPTTPKQNEIVYPLIDLLPYKGTNFVVNVYDGPMTLHVITNGNIKTVSKEIYKWMQKNNVATESHKLIFSSQ